MRPTIAQLMRYVNSEKWPERWNGIYDSVMDDYEKNGCRLAEPAYYDYLSEKYGMFRNCLDIYKTAVAEVAKDEYFCRLLALLCAAMQDREHIAEDIENFALPVSPDGGRDVKRDMITALSMCSTAEYTYKLLVGRGLPAEHVKYGMCLHEGMVTSFMRKNGGAYGAMSWGWYQLAVDAKLYRIGSFEMEIGRGFFGRATVFENGAGEQVALACGRELHRDGFALGAAGYTDEEGSWTAEIEESEDSWSGYAYDERGFVVKDKVTLKKSEWKKVLEPGDPIISVHIPHATDLRDESVARSFADTVEFMEKYFPDVEWHGLACGSWMMNPRLCEILGESSNLSKFAKRFCPMCSKNSGKAIFSFVFQLPTTKNIDISALPENTTLERKLKELYLSGDVLHEMTGYITRNKITK